MDDFFSQIGNEIKSGGLMLAQDWIRQTVDANRPQIRIEPQPVATLPADVVAVQSNQNKYILYIAIAISLIGVLFLFKGKKGKK